MKSHGAKIVILALLMAPHLALAQNGENMYGNNGGISDGEAGARAGTLLYNQLNPTNPLPITGGSVIPDTVTNMGAGQGLGEAWSNAARSNSGLDSAPPAPQGVTPE